MQRFQEIYALHQAGELKRAKAGYEKILAKTPTQLDALHALALLHLQEKNDAEAIRYLEFAISHHPCVPVLTLHLANVYKLQREESKAIQLLENLIATAPHFAPAYNNLATIYYGLKQLDKAIHYYQKALSLQPNYIDAYYNLSLAFTQTENFQAAGDALSQILTRDPKHFAARYLLANNLMRQNDLANAITEYLAIVKLYPHHFATKTNLATCYLKLGKLKEARFYYIEALDLANDDCQILFNLGVIHTQLDDLDAAIRNYQKLLQIEPKHFAALNNIGALFLAKNLPALALPYFSRAHALEPTNRALDYTIKMLQQNVPQHSAPLEYIKNLFDAYADHYEVHLIQALDYKVPELFYACISEYLSPPIMLDILDLGCGSGLCGQKFKSFAKTLTGIDVSEKMLLEAAKKNVYNALINNDLLQFLAETTNQYDLIMAGDVLVYMGELRALFAKIHPRLRTGGLFIFNTESTDETAYQMTQSGRFTHAKFYLNQLAAEFKFRCVRQMDATTRQQNNQPVLGYIYLLQKD